MRAFWPLASMPRHPYTMLGSFRGVWALTPRVTSGGFACKFAFTAKMQPFCKIGLGRWWLRSEPEKKRGVAMFRAGFQPFFSHPTGKRTYTTQLKHWKTSKWPLKAFLGSYGQPDKFIKLRGERRRKLRLVYTARLNLQSLRDALSNVPYTLLVA